MKSYIKKESENATKEAMLSFEAKGYVKDGDREKYYQANDEYTELHEIYCDDEDGNDTVVWMAEESHDNYSDKTLVTFTC